MSVGVMKDYKLKIRYFCLIRCVWSYLRANTPQKRKDSKRMEESSAAVPQTKGRVGKEERVHLSTIENPYRGNRSPLL
jgi:hypothetical protein